MLELGSVLLLFSPRFDLQIFAGRQLQLFYSY
ncbi:MAG: hypothetical protein EZS28_049523, partial [Streblomastix strix]